MARLNSLVNKYKWSIALIILLIAASSVAATMLVKKGASDRSDNSNGASLRGLFLNETCIGACWQGIEPGVTSRSELEQLLNEQGVEPQFMPDISGGGGKYWWQPSDQPALLQVRYIGVDREKVTLIQLSANLCVSEIVDAFGPPAYIGLSANRDDFSLVYPERGMEFESCSQEI